MKAFDTYLLLLPSGAGGHGDVYRLRVLAELHGHDSWLLGCRDGGLRQGRRQITVTPLEVPGTPAGTIAAALAAAGALRGVDYALAPAPVGGWP
jgi:hypothetical protein